MSVCSAICKQFKNGSNLLQFELRGLSRLRKDGVFCVEIIKDVVEDNRTEICVEGSQVVEKDKLEKVPTKMLTMSRVIIMQPLLMVSHPGLPL